MIANLVRYQIAWLGTVVGAGTGHADVGVTLALLMILLHFYFTPHRGSEVKIVLLSLVLGTILESYLANRGLIVYEGRLSIGRVPLWILVLWAAFGTTLNGCLGWFQSRLWLAGLFGAMGGPISWYAGVRLGALHIPAPLAGYSNLALGWAIFMPLLSWSAKHLSASNPPNTGKETPHA